MATTPNYGWVTPAPTDFVTDLPADFEIFADAVDGDLAGLLGGTAGQVLTKASATDHDFAFADAGGAGSSFSLLNTGGTALTGATTITVSGITDKEKLLVLVAGASSANAASDISIRFNTDSGANYIYRGLQITAGNTYDAANFEPSSGSSATEYAFARMASNAASTVSGSLLIEGCKSTGFKNVSAVASGNANANGQVLRSTQGLYLGTSAITSVSINSFTGNFDAGTIFVYGSDN
jgi:hypothetical protein